MKKVLLVCVIILAMALLALCFWQENIDTAKYEFLPEEQLEKCLVPDLPSLPCGANVSRLAFDSEFYFYTTEADFNKYVANVYAYLSSQGFEYLGRRGDVISSFLGGASTYEFFEGGELFDFRLFFDKDGEKLKNSYIFVWTNGESDETGALPNCCYLELSYTALQEYGEDTGFCYNAVLKLKTGGLDSYKLTEEASGGFVRAKEDFVPYALAYTAPKSIDEGEKKVSFGIFYGILDGENADSDYESAEITLRFENGEELTVETLRLSKLEKEEYKVYPVETEAGELRLVYEYEEKFTFSTELLENDEGVLTLTLTEYAFRGEEGEICGFSRTLEIPYRKADGKIFFGE